MHIRCSKCPWMMHTGPDSTSLAEWLLQCHHWEMHEGKEPEVAVKLGWMNTPLVLSPGARFAGVIGDVVLHEVALTSEAPHIDKDSYSTYPG